MIPSSFRKHAGTTLIEVLVSMVIIALGLMGYALLNVKSHKANLTAYYRSQATMAANNFLEGARAHYALLATTGYSCTLKTGTNPCTTAPSSVSNARQQDFKDFADAVNALPGGDAYVTSAPATKKYAVVILWSSTDANDVQSSFETDTFIN